MTGTDLVVVPRRALVPVEPKATPEAATEPRARLGYVLYAIVAGIIVLFVIVGAAYSVLTGAGVAWP